MAELLKHKVKVGNNKVTTTVVNTITQLDQSLGDLLSTISVSMTFLCRPLIAIDIERHYYQDESKRQVTEKVAVVKLCFDKTCLIIQLLQIKEPPSSLAEFLQFQELTFVGVGIKPCLDALSRDYGISCRNAVDLGELAANVKGNDKYKSYGLLDLAYELQVFSSGANNWTWHEDGPVRGGAKILGGWGGTKLSQQCIETATWSAFLCSCVSKTLFTGVASNFI